MTHSVIRSRRWRSAGLSESLYDTHSVVGTTPYRRRLVVVVELVVSAPHRDSVGARRAQATLADKVVFPNTVSDFTVPTSDSVGLSSAKGDVAAHGDVVRERGVSCDGERIHRLVTQVHIAAEDAGFPNGKGARSSQDACDATDTKTLRAVSPASAASGCLRREVTALEIAAPTFAQHKRHTSDLLGQLQTPLGRKGDAHKGDNVVLQCSQRAAAHQTSSAICEAKTALLQQNLQTQSLVFAKHREPYSVGFHRAPSRLRPNQDSKPLACQPPCRRGHSNLRQFQAPVSL